MKSLFESVFLFGAVAGEHVDSTGLLQLGRTKHKQSQVGVANTRKTTCDLPPDGGYCRVYGDPHVKPFDSKDHSQWNVALTNTGDTWAKNGMSASYAELDNYKNGDYWLVNSDLLKVQGRLWANSGTAGLGMSFLRSIAVSGTAFNNEVIAFQPGGIVSINGISMTSDNAPSCLEIAWDCSGTIVLKPAGSTSIAIKVQYSASHMNVWIYMPTPGSASGAGVQSGFCGDFSDTDPSDTDYSSFTSTDVDMLKDDASKVQDYDRLFTSRPYQWEGCTDAPHHSDSSFTKLVTHGYGGPTDITDTCARICIASGHFVLSQAADQTFRCYCKDSVTLCAGDCTATESTCGTADIADWSVATGKACSYNYHVPEVSAEDIAACAATQAAIQACADCPNGEVDNCLVDFCDGGSEFVLADTCSNAE